MPLGVEANDDVVEQTGRRRARCRTTTSKRGLLRTEPGELV